MVLSAIYSKKPRDEPMATPKTINTYPKSLVSSLLKTPPTLYYNTKFIIQNKKTIIYDRPGIFRSEWALF